ncbi:hypothetical protein F5Y16DRAFT_400399 [Xylariaceae sp. FL0255]|nr:hypothetical protein F5Y16DRAFT_400399 [Xylariaceae sp. FL0255]
MHFIRIATVSLLAVLSRASVMRPLASRQSSPDPNITCQTSDASPSIADVFGCVTHLNVQGGFCPNTNNAGSHCTTIMSFGDAHVGMCGEDDSSGGTALLCSDAGPLTEWVRQACNMNGKAGGTYTISPSKWLIVY